jgi:Xaa-Pro aminopeptidase
VDPKLIAFDAAKKMGEQLLKEGRIELVPINDNLVDAIWQDRPAVNLSPIMELPLKYSGRSVEDKLRWLRTDHLAKSKCSGLLLNALDEIACTTI